MHYELQIYLITIDYLCSEVTTKLWRCKLLSNKLSHKIDNQEATSRPISTHLGGTTDCIVAWPWILLFATNHLILEAMVPAQNHRCSSLAGLGHHHLFEALAKSTHSSSRVPSVQSAYP